MKHWMYERDQLIEQTLAFVQGVAAARPAQIVAAASEPAEQARPVESPKPAAFAPIRVAPLVSERADIERRVANFKAQQQKFQRARESQYDVIFSKARATPGNQTRP